MAVVVFFDSAEGKVSKNAPEAIFYGKKVADKIGGTVTAVTYGNISSSDLEALGAYGASKVVVAKSLSSFDPQQATVFIAGVVANENSSVVITSFDPAGKALAPRIAARLKAGLVSGAVGVPETDNGFVVKKNVFSGKAFAHVNITSSVKVISLLPNSFKPEAGAGTAAVEEFSGDVDSAGLTVTEVVVSAGRGLKGPENWGMIEELAKELDAATACSRPVADIGWRPHHEHVGQTGVAIRPDLYFAIGISGAIQHLAGVNGSKVMVAINTDPEAPFFKAAHYGVIGDAFDVVPKLIEAVKKFKANN
jgi:electron transfer flavoprotein alpha subunit